MRSLSLLVLALVPASALAQAGHPAVRYGCMSDPVDGSSWPWVTDGVPFVIESQHPGYGIDHYDDFTVAGLQLFVIRGSARHGSAPDRYAFVEAVDEAGGYLRDRALFLRAAASTSDPNLLARYAMAFLLRRADERPLGPSRASELDPRIRDRVVGPWLDADTLHFWVRADSASPYASEVRVERATGIHLGDVW